MPAYVKPTSSNNTPTNASFAANMGVGPVLPANTIHAHLLPRMHALAARSGATWQLSRLTETVVDIRLLGPRAAVHQLRLGILVALDEAAGWHADHVDVDVRLHPILSARHRTVLASIMADTRTRIYLPSPLPPLGPSSFSTNPSDPAAPTSITHVSLPNATEPRLCDAIEITGEPAAVQRARESLYQVAMHKVQVGSYLKV